MDPLATLGTGALPTAVVAVAFGIGWGIAADRIAARWPAHEEAGVRGSDWRTVAVALFGAASGWLLAPIVAAPTPAGMVAVLVVATYVLLFATDLDQRVLPDMVTYPLAALALAAFVLGINPFVATPPDLAIAAAAAAAIPLALYALSIPFGAGAIGRGDLKFLAGFGLLVGPGRLFLGLIAGAIVAAAVILVLVAVRRITLRTYVPYGPFLIIGAVWALLAPG